ncbi:MAG TPA: N-acetylmuramoyl-L-alanine amidase [Solirubrobacteraceae bacterium]|nr:N-acetylmuramoyl-L-alanine amidase [Solirubrobacteraceae bacterium]
MRRLPLLLLPVLAALGLLAAPALSLERWRPGPVDFALELGDEGLERGANPGATYVSDPIRAPKRFDLMGLQWADSEEPIAVWIRTRDGEGPWSPWVEATSEQGEPASDGVWAGGADTFQARFTAPPEDLEASFVNTTGTATIVEEAATALRGAANTVVLATVGNAVAWAQGAGGPPAIVPREAWAGDDCVPRERPSMGRVEMGFVHHTVSTNDYSADESGAVVLAMCRYHRNSLGWNDIGYNFLVDRWGRIYEGRAGGIDKPVIGAQTQGFNGVSTGVAAIGTYTSATPPPEQVSAIASLLAWKLPAHGVPTTGKVTVTSAGGSANRFPSGQRVTFERISAHRDAGKSLCPGDGMMAQFASLRAQAAQREQPLSSPDGAAQPPPEGQAVAVEIQPSKLQILRAGIDRSRRVLDVHAPISARASGMAQVELHAAQRRHTFQAPVNSQGRRINFREAIPAAQARLGTGILTIRYPGDPDTRPQELRLRAANRPSQLALERPRLESGVLSAQGTVNPRATGVVRVSISYVHRGQTHVVERKAPVSGGRWSLVAPLPPEDTLRIAQRSGTVHSITAYTGDLDARLRGEARAYQVLGAP